MAGIYGNSIYDKDMERKLYKYLDELDIIECPKCMFTESYDVFEKGEDDYEFICPECGERINI